MRAVVLGLVASGFLLTGSAKGFAANVMITTADTLVLDGSAYKLDGLDGPKTDQTCMNPDGTVWACGIEARDRVRELVGTRAVKCISAGFDSTYRSRRIGRCSVDGEDLSARIVNEGWAISFEPQAHGRFKSAETEARAAKRGLWKGCFATPRNARYTERKEAALLGSGCHANNPNDREQLFPRERAMPEGCAVKGKQALRARITGHAGIYYMEGCRSYGRLKYPDRWFCSEAEAQAEGYRKVFSCRK
jgi:endonuclease YncB( thermonuclease family)